MDRATPPEQMVVVERSHNFVRKRCVLVSSTKMGNHHNQTDRKTPAKGARPMTPLVAKIRGYRQIEDLPTGNVGDAILCPVVFNFMIVEDL
jgi:hypothetical protein